jgi:hypothetical protein
MPSRSQSRPRSEAVDGGRRGHRAGMAASRAAMWGTVEFAVSARTCRWGRAAFQPLSSDSSELANDVRLSDGLSIGGQPVSIKVAGGDMDTTP